MNQIRGGLFGSVPPVTLNIIIVTAICWLAQILLGSRGIDVTNYLGLHYFTSESFYPHQIITYMFMHDPSSIFHLVFNMFALFMFGRTLEMVWGPRRFLFFYIATGIGAALLNMLIIYIRIKNLESDINPELVQRVYQEGLEILRSGKNYSDPVLGQFNLLINYSMVGASGAVFGILVAFGMLFPNTELMIIPIPIPIKAKYFVILYGILELFLGISNRAGDNVAHFAHLGGLLVGFIIVLYWKKQNKKNGRFF